MLTVSVALDESASAAADHLLSALQAISVTGVTQVDVLLDSRAERAED